jgi:uncharacterized damage-inducible protein DinB
MPTIAELLVAELDQEMAGTRRALERVPEGQNDWKPHEKSMALGYLAGLTATMPGWIVSMVEDAALDLEAPGRYRTIVFESTAELVAAFDREVAAARAALQGARDEHLLTTSWQLRMGDRVLLKSTRYEAVRASALNHLYHHRAQLTTYLRLNEKPVPSLYGPSADEAYPGA